jgi:hypothetical protein
MTESNQFPPPPPGDPNTPTTPSSGTPIDYGGTGGPIETNPQARQWGMITHLSALVGLLGLPTIIGPLIVWLIKKQEFPFVDQQGKEAVNFHLTVLIAAIIISPTICIGIGIVLLVILGIGAIVLSIIAGMKANEGVAYRYPWTLRLIK